MIKAFSLLATLVCVMWSIARPEAAHIVFMIGEDEYQTWDTLPEFAERDLKPLGYRVTTVKADEADKNNFRGLVDALRTADLLFVSVRRRTPRTEQLEAVRAHLAAGKPLAGIRTASHAFALRPADPPVTAGHSTWQAFDPEVLGGHYSNHHGAGPSTTVAIASGADTHAILKGVSVRSIVSAGSLYKVSPLEKGTTPLLMGTIPGQAAEPVAWTNEYGPKRARIFYTSLGHPGDFKNAEFRRLLTNAIGWALRPN
jgi:type 1 glutamine amidotransferase